MTLKDFFKTYPKVALAFSGGVDSAFLLSEAKKYAKEVKAYFVFSAFQPEFEKTDAKKLAEELGVSLQIIELDVLSNEQVKSNPQNRCYYCKKMIFSAIKEQAQKDGFSVLLDGTNASDKTDDRPGIKALSELQVLSPLKLCSLSKSDVRKLSKEAGLFTWEKPSYACLATRIPTGTEIKKADLEQTEKAEEFLKSLGFSDFRIRLLGTSAKIEVRENQLELLLQKRNEIINELKKYYSDILLNLEVRNVDD